MYIYEQNYAFKGTSEMQVNLAILKGCKKIDYNWCVGFKVKQGKYVTVTVLWTVMMASINHKLPQQEQLQKPLESLLPHVVKVSFVYYKLRGCNPHILNWTKCPQGSQYYANHNSVLTELVQPWMTVRAPRPGSLCSYMSKIIVLTRSSLWNRCWTNLL